MISVVIEKFDDPALSEACDVYASLDNRAFTFVGTTYESCTELNPFKLPCDPGLINTTIYLKFCRHGKRLGAEKAHECQVREEWLAIASSLASPS